MKNRVFSQFRAIVRRRLLPRRHTALLVALVTVFAVRPLLGDTAIAALIFSVAMVALMLAALYTVQVDELRGEREALLAQKRRWSIVGWVLAVGALTERLSLAFVQSRAIVLTGAICWLLLFSFVTWHELRAVLRQREVTDETISMSISVYLLMGLTWGLLYILLYLLNPRALSVGASTTPASGPPSDRMFSIFPVIIYFSFITLATVGYGDVTPVSLEARYAALAEGVAGQFYVAIVVARLVGLHMSKYITRQQDTSNSESKGSAGRK